MIIFKKVRAKNFLSIGNQYLEYDLNKDHLTFLRGKNGDGKSLFTEIITFSLYKKAYRNINLPQLVNNVNKKDCVSEIEFSIGETEWKIIRGLAPNIFEIYKNGQMLDQHSSAIEQQKWLEQNVLKMSYKTFVQIVVLGTGSFVPFMQLVPADRREVIEDLLDIKLFSSMNLLVKEKIKEMKDSVKILNLQKDSCEDKIQMQRNFIENIEQRSRNDIQEKSDTITQLFASVESLQTDNNVINGQIQELQTKLEELTDVSDKLKVLLSDKTKLTIQAQNLKETFKFFKDNDTCPTCSQHIEDEFKKEKQKETKKEMSGLKKTYDNLLESIESETQRQNRFKEVSSEVTDLNQKISYNNYQIQQRQNQIKELHKQIKKITDAINSKNDEHQKMDEYVKNLDEIKTGVAEIKDEIHNHEYVQLLLKDSGVKSRVIEKYLKIINSQITKYLNLLELYVNFTLDSEFNEQIMTPTFENFSYGNFSEGQKRRVDLALLFTWRYISSLKNSANTNLLICDEILDGSLDEMGHFAFLKIIKDEMKNSNVFVISHRDGIEHRFDKVISIEKKGNFTVKTEN